MSTRSFSREASLAALRDDTFDVVVVGGGITGAGVALDAAARGLRTALLERHDWASGTSSKSSKLVHGGLRYLQQREYRLVAENLAERQRLLVNAPHLVTPLPFLVPLFGRNGVVNQAVAKGYSTALWMYDLAGGMRIGHRHRRIDNAEVARHMPGLRTDRLAAGFLYYDAWADDARLTLTVARTAVDHGAVAANHLAVEAIVRGDGGRVSGVRLANGSEVAARVVVNAGGVWADHVQELASPGATHAIRPAKGVHITLPAAKLSCDIAAVLPVPGDRRSVFVVPWGDHVYVGTTDTDYDGPLDDPRCTAQDVEYLLGAVNAAVTEPVSESDVTGTWAGLRPLVAAASTERTADLSRRHAVTSSPDGVVSVTGGKLTTYRKMAADTVDEAVRLLGRGPRRSPTRRLRLHGAAATSSAGMPAGVDHQTWSHLKSRHGDEAAAVAALALSDPQLAEPLVAGLPYLAAEAVWAVREEMATTLEDVLARRTRALLLDREATAAAAPNVARLIGRELAWDEDQTDAQISSFLSMVEAERDAAGARP